MTGYLKFLASSSVAPGISEAVLAIATGLLNLHYIAGTCAGMTTGFVLNYLVSRKYVWV
jgi:putative flippase GtrA